MTHNHHTTDVDAPKTLAEKGKVSTTGTFKKPDDVVNAEDLTTTEKKDILEQWEDDAKSLQRATDEGMSGGKRPGLAEVKRAQTKLNDAT